MRFLTINILTITLLFASAGWAKTVDQVGAQISQLVSKIELPRIPDNVKKLTVDDLVNTDRRKQIVDAIAMLVKQGGGKLILGKGLWLSHGPIVLQSNIELHLECGATLRFAGQPENYLPAVKKRWEGTEVMSYSPLIYANNVHDIAITGCGTIDGNEHSPFHQWHSKQNDDIQRLRRMGIDGTPVEKRVFTKGTYLRPALIQIFGAKRVLLQGYTAINSPFWVNHLVYTDHAIVRDLNVASFRPNNDGVDIESSRFVLVENNTFRTGDDAVVIKSGRDKDGRDINRPSQYIVVRHNDMGGEDGIGLGSEMSGGISYVYFTDNILRTGKAAMRFKGSLDRGGLVENIWVRNLQVESFDELIWFQLNYPGVIEGGHPSIYRNIVFDNITVKRAGTVFEAHAFSEAPIENLHISNLTVKHADVIFNLEHVKAMTLKNVSINGQKITGKFDWQ